MTWKEKCNACSGQLTQLLLHTIRLGHLQINPATKARASQFLPQNLQRNYTGRI